MYPTAITRRMPVVGGFALALLRQDWLQYLAFLSRDRNSALHRGQVNADV